LQVLIGWHTWPQLPQFEALIVVSDAGGPHAVPPPGHVHVPAVHTDPSGTFGRRSASSDSSIDRHAAIAGRADDVD